MNALDIACLTLTLVGFPMWVTVGILDNYRPDSNNWYGHLFFAGFLMMMLGIGVLIWSGTR